MNKNNENEPKKNIHKINEISVSTPSTSELTRDDYIIKSNSKANKQKKIINAYGSYNDINPYTRKILCKKNDSSTRCETCENVINNMNTKSINSLISLRNIRSSSLNRKDSKYNNIIQQNYEPLLFSQNNIFKQGYKFSDFIGFKKQIINKNA